MRRDLERLGERSQMPRGREGGKSDRTLRAELEDTVGGWSMQELRYDMHHARGVGRRPAAYREELMLALKL